MGKKNSGGVFANWLKNFTTMVFLQSFHAVFLMIIMKFLSIASTSMQLEIKSGDSTDTMILAMISIVGMSALIKMEKLIKSMFGFEDSKMIGGLADNLKTSMAAIGSGINLAKRTMEPGRRQKEAHKNVKAAQKKVDRLKELSDLPSESSSSNSNSNSQTNVNHSGIITNPNEVNDLFNNRNNPAAGGNVQLTNDAINRLIAALENNSNALASNTNSSGGDNPAESKLKKQWELQDAEEELAKAKRDEEVAKRQQVTRLMTTVAAGAMGFGGTDNISDAVTFANLADIPMDWATDRMVEKDVNLDYAKEYNKDYQNKKASLEAQKSRAVSTAKTNAKNKAINEGKLEHEADRIADEVAKDVAEEYDKQIANMKNLAQDFLNDIPENIVKSMSEAWLDSTKIALDIPARRASKAGKVIKTAITTRDFGEVKRAAKTPRSIDDIQ